MSKETARRQKRNKVTIPVESSMHPRSFQCSGSNKSAIPEKTGLMQHDLKNRYRYLTADLKAIAIISIPMVLAVIIAYVFFR
jgi:hypothetical protein